ncbi:centromere protein C-like isoform X2 [Thrips palmi]|uniref:Centromere protein C-like isoform X2 n=1 Tax=Thrips palmi TaxID=161013 RepID=A0A6P8YCA8_THRPL|nr:centromere protein C-like isoform X2 [Thrips palmi]
MKFRGFLKKGNIKRKSNELTISDPGSDDSWDVLCKTDNQDNNVPTGTEPIKALHTVATASTSSTAPIVKGTSQITEVIADSSPTHTKTANISVESQTNVNSKKLLPFTSTPFVRHKQVPVFEVSSIISPVDGPTNERIPEQEVQNYSGSLVLNRKNSADPADDTFNQLLEPGKSVKKRSSRELGVRPLKSLINQGDTTRQYAGGALKGRTMSSVNPPINSTEGSWETTEASTTCTADLKKTSISPDKIPIRNRLPIASSHSSSKEKTMAKINHPNEIMNLQDENKVQSSAGSLRTYSPRKYSRKKQSGFTEISDAQTTDKGRDRDLIVSKKCESHDVGGDLPLTILNHDKVTLELEENHQQRTTERNEVRGTVEELPNHINTQSSDQTLVQLNKASSHKTQRKSIIIDHTKEKGQGLKKRVSFAEVPEQTTNAQEDSAMKIKSKTNYSKELEPETESYNNNKGKNESKKGDKNTPRDESISTDPQVSKEHALVHSSDHANKNNQLTQNLQKSSDVPCKEVNMICQSNFAVKIGNTVIKQSSCFGVAVDLDKNKSSKNDKVEHTLVAPACIVGGDTNKEKSNPNITEPEDRHKSSNNTKAHAVKQSNARELLSSAHKTSSIQQNKPKEIESSSEEERILLRAQSLKLRENQNNARNSKSLEKSNQLGLNSRHNISPFKSPVKSLSCDIRPAQYASPTGVRESLFSVPQGTEQPQPLTPDALNFHNESASSCDIFISRQPSDCQSNFAEDHFELEIMSSSEEEKVASQKLLKKQSPTGKLESNATQSHKPLKEDEVPNPKHLKKVSRLSSKAKEIRRRRKEKIEEKRRSQGNSSDSDSPSPRPLQKRISRRGTKTPFSSAREVTEIEKCKKKLLQDNVDEKSAAMEILDAQQTEKNFTAMPSTQASSSADMEILNAQQAREISTAMPSIEASSNQNSQNHKSKEKQKKSTKKRTQENFNLKKTKSPKGKLVTNGPVSSRDALQGKQRMMTEVQMDDDLIQEEEKGNPIKNQNILIELPNHDELASGIRCSQRSRKPPSMYWLGNRAHNNLIIDYVTENEGTSQSRKKTSYKERKTSNPKGQKRKIDKTSKLDVAKTSKRVKQIEEDPASSQVDTSPSHPDVDRVLIYDTYNLNENGVKKITCLPMEVKTTEFVWGCGVKGDLITLGPEAACEDQRSSTYNQVFYVLEGKMNYECSKDEKILTTGSVFIVPRGETYNIRNLGDSTAKLFVTSCSV